jgi:hypothetical protein
VRFRNATGNNNVKAFRLGDGQFARAPVNEALTLAPDRANHGVIEPATRMLLESYKTAIADTRHEWDIDEP